MSAGAMFQKIKSNITENVESLAENLSKNKLQDELFKFAERGDLNAFVAALPESKMPAKERMVSSNNPGNLGADKNKRMTLAMGLGSVTSLFKKDVDLNAQNENGYTVLHLAALNGHDEFVEKMLEFGVETLAKDNSGNSALHLAAWNGHVNILRALLKAGSNVNDVNLEGNTPLHFTAQYGKDKLSAQALLENGANPLIRNRVYETPLDLAARFGRLQVVAVLAVPEVLNQIYRRGERPRSSPLHLAALNGHVEVVRQLLASGVDINTANFEGSTPLHEATQYGKRNVVLLLLQNGASVSAVNDRNQTPLKLFNAFNAAAQNNPIQAILQAAEQGVNPGELETIMNNTIAMGPARTASPIQQQPNQIYSAAPPMNNGYMSAAAPAYNSPYSAAPQPNSNFSPAVPAAAASNNIYSAPPPANSAASSGGARVAARAVVHYPGSAYDATVLSFDVGDTIWVEEQNASGWWRGVHEKTGKRGDFKANYVEILSDEDLAAELSRAAPAPVVHQPQPILDSTLPLSSLPATTPVFPASRPQSIAPSANPVPMPRSNSSGNLSRSSSGSNFAGMLDMPTSGPPPTRKPPVGGVAVGIPMMPGGIPPPLKPAAGRPEVGAKLVDDPADSVQAPLPEDAKWIERWLYELKLERYLNNFTDNGYDSRELVVEMGPGDLEMIDVKLPGHRKKLLLAIDKLRTNSASMPPVKSPSTDFSAMTPPVAAPRPKSGSMSALDLSQLPDPSSAPPSTKPAMPALPKPIAMTAPQAPAARAAYVPSQSNNELESLLNSLETPIASTAFPAAMAATAAAASPPPKAAFAGLPKPPPAPKPEPEAMPAPPVQAPKPTPAPVVAAAPVAIPPSATKPAAAPIPSSASKPAVVPPSSTKPIAAAAPTPAPAPIAAKPAVASAPAPAAAPAPTAAAVAAAATKKAEDQALKESFDNLMGDVDDIMAGLEAELDSMI